MRGVFITFEGMDGAGKTTQAAMLASFLRGHNKTVWETREPGGSEIGETLRKIVMEGELDGVTEALLMAAARREHVVRRIHPALVRGEWVVCDRYSDSTFAYQGGGRGVCRKWIAQVMRETEGGASPDLTFYLQADAGSAAQPLLAAGDNFENQENKFYRATESEYKRLAKEHSDRIVAVPAFVANARTRRDREEIAAEIRAIVLERFSEMLQ